MEVARLDTFQGINAKRRELLTGVETLRNRRKMVFQVFQEIAALKKAGQDAS